MRPNHNLVWLPRVDRCEMFCTMAFREKWKREDNQSFLIAVACSMVIDSYCGGKWANVWWTIKQIFHGYHASFIAWRYRDLSEEEFAKKLENM